MKRVLISLSATMALSSSLLLASDTDVKRVIKGGVDVYNIMPKESSDGFLGIFSQGMYYGRIRSNTFKWDWQQSDDKDHVISAIGGSLIYKTAYLNGFNLNAGLYYSYAFSNVEIKDKDKNDISKLKAGRAVLSRYDISNGHGKYGMFVPAQYFVEYNNNKTIIRAGEQLWESMFTRSNDAKMIPNSFMGVTLTNKSLDKTTIRGAWFHSQKLMDHTSNHDLITFKTNDDGTKNYKWNNNDDSVVNKSLSYDKLKAAGMSLHHYMIMGDIKTKAVDKNLKLILSGNYINEIITQGGIEAHYKIDLGGISIKPGVRYIYQKGLTGDKLTKIANLKKDTTGYSNPDSLDSGLLAARVDFNLSNGVKFRYGYSKVEDKADMMAMWRGFPTGGFTAVMSQYNWYANTVTHTIRADVNLGKMGILKGTKLKAQYAIQDFDNSKTGVQKDTNVLHIDINKKLLKNLSAKVRYGTTLYVQKDYESKYGYDEYRLEFNYLF